MIHKTRGIVFRFTRYGETSIIVSIFTEAFGIQSYIINGVRSKSSKNKIALYQPLTLLNLVVYHREHANLERIKELHCFYPYQSLTVDIKKSTIAMFITELLNKTVKEESAAGSLFEFLVDALISIDKLGKNEENAHLIFMIKLSRYLGFGPQFSNEVLGGRVADEKTELILQQLLTADFDNALLITNEQRRNLLDLLLKFYAEHLENFGELKSVQVLRDVLT
ncbi:MAG TPA: DNA repair protein RecO [Chryseosolibacter sp.]